ncbi:MAG: sulfotransferase domain-containing protein [Gammaproteobacteria bacterium]|nr:sulfotransferase domain-containing protein [Gammaproteobacteria bacterium]
MEKPKKTYDYSVHHVFDPERWDQFSPRQGDVVVTTSQRAGTTWTQVIVANLIFQDGNIPGPIGEISPWYDLRFSPFEPMQEALEAQTHRRSIKSHLPLNGLTFYEQLNYIVVGRDTRDAFMSLLHHHRGLSIDVVKKAATYDDLIGRSFPPDVGSDKDFWRQWISQSWFEWETQGYPYWSHLNHAQSWWSFRKLPNILLVHFEDLLNDTEGEIKRIANFLDITIDEKQLPSIKERTRFEEISKNMDKILPEMNMVLRDGPSDYMYKYGSGLWHDFLDDEDIELYQAAVKKTLSPDCARWLEQGRTANDIDL